MDRLRYICALICITGCSHYNKNAEEALHLRQIYFGDQSVVRCYNDLVSENGYSYLKVYDLNEGEIFKFESDEYSSIGIDSLVNDSLFINRKRASSRLDTNLTEYRLIEQNRVKVFSRDLFFFGGAEAGKKRMYFIKRNKNDVYFLNEDSNITDTINLRNIEFSGDEVLTVKYIEDISGIIIVGSRIRFRDDINKKNFFESLSVPYPGWRFSL